MTPRRLGGGGVSAVPSRSAVQWGGGVPCTGGLEGSREAMHPRAELRPAKEGSLLLTFTKVSLGQQQTRCGWGSSQGVIDGPPVRSAAQYVTSAELLSRRVARKMVISDSQLRSHSAHTCSVTQGECVGCSGSQCHHLHHSHGVTLFLVIPGADTILTC